jgi:hypothetical protein
MRFSGLGQQPDQKNFRDLITLSQSGLLFPRVNDDSCASPRSDESMNQWFDRWQQRRSELQHGADADLLRDNRKRWIRGFWLLGFGFALLGVQALFQLSGLWHNIAVGLTMTVFAVGLFLWSWARAESAFLNRPSPKQPPRLWK